MQNPILGSDTHPAHNLLILCIFSLEKGEFAFPEHIQAYSTTQSGRPRRRDAASSVLRNRQAIVIGPTPPGTGVMAPATRRALSKSTSPTSRTPPCCPVTRLIPTSMTVAPGLIQSP